MGKELLKTAALFLRKKTGARFPSPCEDIVYDALFKSGRFFLELTAIF